MHRHIYQDAAKKMKEGAACNLVTVVDRNSPGAKAVVDKYIITQEDGDFVRVPTLKDDGENVCCYEPIGQEDRLILLGGGHISKALCSFAAKVGFSLWVVDEREEFANSARFPEAKKVICGPYEKVLPDLAVTKADYVAIVTRGHSRDGECLGYMLTHEMPGYLGMIGSKRRVGAQLAMFQKEGISREKIDKVHTPIGLDIKAVTPEEIAVSILAELILSKRSRAEEDAIQTDLEREMIVKIAENKEPAAVATIVKTAGSTPRKEGSKMLVYKDGSIEGTIGGGLGEATVIQRAVSMIGSGESELFPFVMNANVAMQDGMACGGKMDVLIEDITERQEVEL